MITSGMLVSPFLNLKLNVLQFAATYKFTPYAIYG
nr:MAG TPA: hypothetical protein [Caudoviricetes sp.]